jgi:hypothetical protein
MKPSPVLAFLLGDHQREPSCAKVLTEADECLRERSGKHDVQERLPAGQPEHSSEFI